METTTEYFTTNDNQKLAYLTAGDPSLPPLILLHGFTGSSQVFKKNIPTLSPHFRIYAPDLRGHGSSSKPTHGFHVSRLAMDLHELLSHLHLSGKKNAVKCVAGSLGASILWSYSELFTADVFGHMVWVDQAPMQNLALDGSWGPEFANRGMNCESAVRGLKATLARDPDEAYKGTIAACLGYRYAPVEGEIVSEERRKVDEEFFLEIARKGRPEWYGDLMAEHTALDWRKAIVEGFGGRRENETKLLIVASSRSGCFPAAGVMKAVELANEKVEGKGRAEGVVVDWGGHWCYWEDPDKFGALVSEFLLGERT